MVQLQSIVLTHDSLFQSVLFSLFFMYLKTKSFFNKFQISADEIEGKVERKQVTEDSWEFNNTLEIHNNNLSHKDCPISDVKTAQLHSTQVFIEEDINDISIITETNNLDENENKNEATFINLYSEDNMIAKQHTKTSALEDAQSYERLKNERYCVAAHFSNFESSNKQTDLSQSVDSLEEESLTGTVVKRNTFYESHSLELLDEAKKLSHHSRNKSMSACSSHNWSKSVDMLSKPCRAESLPRDSKRIDAQLKCYDEALRELAEEQRIKEDLLHKTVKSNTLPYSNVNKSISCNANCVNQKPHVTQSQRAILKYDSISMKDKPALDCYKKTCKQIKKSNTTDVLSFNDWHQRKSATCPHDTAIVLSESTPEITEVSHIKLKSEQAAQTYFQKPPNHLTISTDKHKAYKKRSSSVGSKNKRKSVDSTLKLYNSLEFPPPYIKDVLKETMSGTWDKYTRINSKKQKIQFLQSHANQMNQKHTKKDGVSGKYYEPHSCPKKSHKNEKYDLSQRMKKEENEVTNNLVERSVSMYNQQTKNTDVSKNLILKSKDIVSDEKSDTDSEWNDQQLQNKRKHFLAMHGAVADSEDSNDEDPPFWLSKEGCFTRQNTVIPNENTSNRNAM